MTSTFGAGNILTLCRLKNKIINCRRMSTSGDSEDGGDLAEAFEEEEMMEEVEEGRTQEDSTSRVMPHTANLPAKGGWN